MKSLLDKFDQTQKKAVVILCVIGILTYSKYLIPQLSNYIGLLIVNIIVIPLQDLWIVYLIRAIRGDQFLENKVITVWGYVWRCCVIQISVSIPVAILGISVFGNPLIPSIELTLFASVFNSLFAVFVILLVYSNKKKEQFLWAISSIKLL